MEIVKKKSDHPKRYLGLHFSLLRFFGLGWWHHPDEEDTRNFPGLYIYYSIITELLWVVTFISLETVDPFIGDKEVHGFMFSLSFVITHDLSVIKLYLFLFRNVDLQEIVHILEIKLKDFYQNHERTRATIRFTRILCVSFVFFGWGAIVFADVYGAIQDLKWKAEVSQLNDSVPIPPRILPHPIYIPWSYQKDFLYISTFALETIGLFWTSGMVMTMDTCIASIILHMTTQFVIIQEALTTVYDRAILKLYKGIKDMEDKELDTKEDEFDKYESVVMAKYSKEEIEEVLENSLKSCFRQHQILIACVEKLGTTYSYGFMTQLLSSTAAICVVMVAVSQDASSFKSMKLAASLSFFMAMTIQLGIQCYTSNDLTLEAGRVAEAVMNCKWERMPSRFRPLLTMMMMRAQRPLNLTAGGFANMDNACFVAIMKAAYSYYAVLSQRQKDAY